MDALNVELQFDFFSSDSFLTPVEMDRKVRMLWRKYVGGDLGREATLAEVRAVMSSMKWLMTVKAASIQPV